MKVNCPTCNRETNHVDVNNRCSECVDWIVCWFCNEAYHPDEMTRDWLEVEDYIICDHCKCQMSDVAITTIRCLNGQFDRAWEKVTEKQLVIAQIYKECISGSPAGTVMGFAKRATWYELSEEERKACE